MSGATINASGTLIVTAYREFSVFDNNDTDGVPIDIYDVNNARQDQSQFTQEFRLSSPTDTALECRVRDRRLRQMASRRYTL